MMANSDKITIIDESNIHLYAKRITVPIQKTHRCPTCGFVHPPGQSGGPWGQCRECILKDTTPTSLGDHTGETSNGQEGMDWNNNFYDPDMD